MMEPKPDSLEEEEAENDFEDDDEEEEEQEEEEDVPNDDDIIESDTDTVETKDTVDSLFETVKFPEDNEKPDELTEKKPPPKINLADFVKQDLKKIISSIEYFDEEKFEGGKKIRKKKEVTVESTEEPKVEGEAAVETPVKAKKRSKTGTSG